MFKTYATPGPWTVYSHPHATGPGSPSELPESAGWPYLIAGPDRGKGYSRLHVAIDIQSIADACLIAAAPDMLAALRQISNQYDQLDGHAPDINQHPAMIARAAIVKATREPAP